MGRDHLELAILVTENNRAKNVDSRSVDTDFGEHTA